MNKKKIPSWQFSSLICFPILSLYSGIGIYNITKIAKVDSYLSIIIAYLLGFILLFLFQFIFHYRKDLNILEKNKYLFGKTLGTIINIIINCLLFFIGMTLLYNISNFTISQFLDRTPILIFMILIGVIIIYNISKGIENITRVSTIFLVIMLFLILFGNLGIIPHFKIDNLKPFLEYGLNPIISAGTKLSIINIVPIFIFLIIKKDKLEKDKKINHKIITFYTIAFLLIFIIHILTMGTLGIYLTEIYQYPEYTVLQKISILNFIERIENFIYIKWILNTVICLSFIIYHISKLFQTKNVKISSTIITISMLILSLKDLYCQ